MTVIREHEFEQSALFRMGDTMFSRYTCAVCGAEYSMTADVVGLTLQTSTVRTRYSGEGTIDVCEGAPST